MALPKAWTSPVATRLIAALLGIVLFGFAGWRAMKAADARRVELRQAQATMATYADWRRRFRPAVAAESIAWRRTWMELQELGVVGDERLALTQAVGRAAESAGLRDVRVVIVGPDTTGSDARLSTEGVRRQAASFGLSVECRGNLQAIVMFLGQLPPSVAPTTLSLARQDGRNRHRVLLAVYELQFLNGPPPPQLQTFGQSPLERGAPRRVNLGGSGG